jgi:hypothetical protein
MRPRWSSEKWRQRLSRRVWRKKPALKLALSTFAGLVTRRLMVALALSLLIACVSVWQGSLEPQEGQGKDVCEWRNRFASPTPQWDALFASACQYNSLDWFWSPLEGPPP